MLKAAEISSTPKPLSQLDFPLTITTPSIEGNTFNYTPVVSQCILIAADQNSTALLLANRPDQTWGQDNCILCVSVKRKLKQVSQTCVTVSKMLASVLTKVLERENRQKKIWIKYSPNLVNGLLMFEEMQWTPTSWKFSTAR